MIDLDLAKELLYRELDVKAELDSRLTTYLLILSMLATGMWLVLGTGISLQSGPEAVKAVSGALAVGLYLVALGFVLRAAIPESYEVLASATDLSEFHDQLASYHDGTDVDVDADFRESLLPRILAAATRAQSNNLSRSARYHRASYFFVGALLFTIVAGATRVYPTARDCLVAAGGDHVRARSAASQTPDDAAKAKAGGAQEPDSARR